MSGENDKLLIKINRAGKESLEDMELISSTIIQKMKTIAEEFLLKKVKNAVITVPVYFNESQIQVTKEAGRIAGLNMERILKEPTAAAMAYRLNQQS